MSDPSQASTVGSTTQALQLAPTGASVVLPVQPEACRALAAALETKSGADPRGEVYLRLEGITGDQPTLLDVYLSVPEGAAAAAHPEHHLGTVGLYGLVQSSMKDKHGGGGQGMGFSLDATCLFKRLRLAGPPVPSGIRVDVIPKRPLPEKGRIIIGKIHLLHAQEH
ncbi:hypothetical protein [Brevifollis gellanilyticus]|uniref:DUF7868 domain-containing protein n=1 Tax=Brevifollis gellanilyticus TaxID=748831 RepID=A0A512M2A8_9BACT|nr:hypothetical protein [Brevifollis gellanilyticus]GEP40874.1 hypothetical protein BGE01nite_01650 [Brevifollis gellanilyticus]